MHGRRSVDPLYAAASRRHSLPPLAGPVTSHPPSARRPRSPPPLRVAWPARPPSVLTGDRCLPPFLPCPSISSCPAVPASHALYHPARSTRAARGPTRFAFTPAAALKPTSLPSQVPPHPSTACARAPRARRPPPAPPPPPPPAPAPSPPAARPPTAAVRPPPPSPNPPAPPALLPRAPAPPAARVPAAAARARLSCGQPTPPTRTQRPPRGPPARPSAPAPAFIPYRLALADRIRVLLAAAPSYMVKLRPPHRSTPPAPAAL